VKSKITQIMNVRKVESVSMATPVRAAVEREEANVEEVVAVCVVVMIVVVVVVALYKAEPSLNVLNLKEANDRIIVATLELKIQPLLLMVK